MEPQEFARVLERASSLLAARKVSRGQEPETTDLLLAILDEHGRDIIWHARRSNTMPLRSVDLLTPAEADAIMARPRGEPWKPDPNIPIIPIKD